jgi:Beta-lactamase enzyme family
VAHRRVLVFVAAAGALVLAVAPVGASSPSGRGTLELRHRVKGAYEQGSISYLRVLTGGRVVYRVSRAGAIHARLRTRAGLYRVTSYQRPCASDCSTLDPPVDRCSSRVRVYAGERSRVRAVTRPGEGCRMRPAEPAAFPPTRRVRAARRWIGGRAQSSFALIDSHGRLRGFAPHRRYVSASVVKAMLLVARLRQIGNRPPGATDRALLAPMIQVSDNDAANAVYGWVGDGGLLALARRARMRDLSVGGHWGAVYFSAADQARFFLRVDRLVPPRSRGYARHLLSSIVDYQRWGFSSVARRRGWRTFFKGGWRQTDLGSLVHEAALFERGRQRFSLAVLTDGNPSHDYGTETLRGVARRLFR